MRLLSPWTDPDKVRECLEEMGSDTNGWQAVHALSTAQWCAPLLYEVIRPQGGLETIPEPVRALFRSDCLENRLRNQLLKTELADLLLEFAGAGIKVVLLKGAATFSDDLYGGIGGRTMLDLDLLVGPEKIPEARALLVAAGYEEVTNEGRVFAGIPTDHRHAHINGYRKPGTPVLVELHYNIAYGQGGRILSAELGWRHTTEGNVNGVPALVLEPTRRLLHTTVHGLIPSCDYIKGEIRLWHLLEFAWLAKRYDKEIDWQAWLGAAEKEGCTTAFLAWLLLAHELLGMPLPDGVVTIGFWPRVQGWRLKSATLLKRNNRGQNDFRKKTRKKFSPLSLLHRGYYFLHLPGWVWRNVCYAEGWGNFPVRVGYFIRKVFSGRSWGKV